MFANSNRKVISHWWICMSLVHVNLFFNGISKWLCFLLNISWACTRIWMIIHINRWSCDKSLILNSITYTLSYLKSPSPLVDPSLRPQLIAFIILVALSGLDCVMMSRTKIRQISFVLIYILILINIQSKRRVYAYFYIKMCVLIYIKL